MLTHRDPPSVRLGHLRENEALREAVFGHDEPPVEWSTPPAEPRPEPVRRIPNEHVGTELTPEGEQYVIPGCEANRSPRAQQLKLFG